jgi:hypothetical protein
MSVFHAIILTAVASAATATSGPIQTKEVLCRLKGGGVPSVDHETDEIFETPVWKISDEQRAAFEMKTSLIKGSGEKLYFDISFVNNKDLYKISGLHAVRPIKQGNYWIVDINIGHGDVVKFWDYEGRRNVHLKTKQYVANFPKWTSLSSECWFKP